MSRRDGREAPEDPTLGDDLVSLLYGEMAPDEAARTGERVAADPALSARLGDMRRVRELFSSMEDDEPPSRLTAQLMAEAARSAPQARRETASVGFWARLNSWLQPLVQRPALAAAASLVLVAGVAGVLYMKKGEELTSTATPTPATGSETAAPTAAGEAAPAAPPPVTAATTADTDSNLADDQAAGDDEAAAPAEMDPAKPSKGKPVAKRSKRADSSGYGDKARDAEERKGGVKSGTVYGLSEQEMVPRDQAPGGAEGGAVGGGAQEKPASPAPAPESAPEPAPAPSQKADGKAPQRPSVSELHKRAVDAALDRRCSDVKLLAGQVRAADAAYYSNTFAGDKRLQGCLSSPKRSPARK